MKKNLMRILMLVLAVSMLCGCSLFASGGRDSGAGSSSGAVKMTDRYTFEDPADLDFDTRYVLHCDENSASIANIPADYGVLGSYSILYAKEDAPAGSYDFYICDSAEHAQACVDLFTAQGFSLAPTEEDPAVLYASSDGDTLEGTLVMMQGAGIVKDATISGYMEFLKTSTGAALVE